MKIMDFDNEKSLNDIINNDTMSDDEVVASYVPPRYLFLKMTSRFLNNTIKTSHVPKIPGFVPYCSGNPFSNVCAYNQECLIDLSY